MYFALANKPFEPIPAKYKYFVDIIKAYLTLQYFEELEYNLLKGSWRIAEAKQHREKLKKFVVRNERRLVKIY